MVEPFPFPYVSPEIKDYLQNEHVKDLREVTYGELLGDEYDDLPDAVKVGDNYAPKDDLRDFYNFVGNVNDFLNIPLLDTLKVSHQTLKGPTDLFKLLLAENDPSQSNEDQKDALYRTVEGLVRKHPVIVRYVGGGGIADAIKRQQPKLIKLFVEYYPGFATTWLSTNVIQGTDHEAEFVGFNPLHFAMFYSAAYPNSQKLDEICSFLMERTDDKYKEMKPLKGLKGSEYMYKTIEALIRKLEKDDKAAAERVKRLMKNGWSPILPSTTRSPSEIHTNRINSIEIKIGELANTLNMFMQKLTLHEEEEDSQERKKERRLIQTLKDTVDDLETIHDEGDVMINVTDGNGNDKSYKVSRSTQLGLILDKYIAQTGKDADSVVFSLMEEGLVRAYINHGDTLEKLKVSLGSPILIWAFPIVKREQEVNNVNV